MDDPQLDAIFRFAHKLPSADQTSGTCGKLLERFAAFVESVEVVATASDQLEDPYSGQTSPSVARETAWTSPPSPIFSAGERQELRRVCCLARPSTEIRVGESHVQEWLPSYGCAIQVDAISIANAQVKVVFPDGWKRVLHSLPSGESVHSAVPTVQGETFCGDVDSDQIEDFTKAFHHEMTEAKNRKGSDRSAVSGTSIGHQKTPAFVATLARNAIRSVLMPTSTRDPNTMEHAPSGGTTDVGLHTGTQPRDTCWPVVCAVLQHNLRDGGSLWQKALAGFQLHLLRVAVAKSVTHKTRLEQIFLRTKAGDRMTELRQGVIKLCDRVDDLFSMLQSVVRLAVSLLEAGHDVLRLQNACNEVREELKALASTASHLLVNEFTLPDSDGLQTWSQSGESIRLVPPPQVYDPPSASSFESVHEYAMKTLGYSSIADGSHCGFHMLDKWVDATRAAGASSSYAMVAILRSVERYMIAASASLIEATSGAELPYAPSELQALVNKYASCVATYTQEQTSNAHLAVEQRSLALLVKWIAFCLVHKHTRVTRTLLDQFKIALRWQDLGVVVLGDQSAVGALQNVAKYIRSFCNKAPKRPLFHLTEQAGTVEFARAFAIGDHNLLELLERENRAWENYVHQMWKTIQAKQRQAVSLRGDIEGEERCLGSSKRELRDAKADQADEQRRTRRYYMGDSCRVSNARKLVKRHEAALRSLNSQLSSTLKMPPSLVKPLPYDREDALRVLFFLNMPRDIEILGEMCITAQFALCPAHPTGEMTTLNEYAGHTAWWHHFNQHKQASTAMGTKSFTLSQALGDIPRNLGPTSIDNVYSMPDYGSRCVWAPRFGGSRYHWGSNFECIDPFRVTIADVRSTFTEAMPLSFANLQWTNNFPGGSTRGNLVYSLLEDADGDAGPLHGLFDKTAFITLGSLRAFPNQQFRQLMCALTSNALPWESSCVWVVVRQALYQVGDLSDEDWPALLWKADLMVQEDGAATFVAVLDALAVDLEQTPRAFEQVPLLSELASFATQFSLAARAVVAKFSSMTREWATQTLDATHTLSAGSSSKQITERRAKACLLYGYALIGYSRMDPVTDEGEVREVCELVVQFHTNLLFTNRAKEMRQSLASLEKRIYDIMARHIASIARRLKADVKLKNCLLTDLLELVVHRAESTPLTWKLNVTATDIDGIGSCYYAYDERSETHYAVNLFTGSVLTNGNAPGGLPPGIRSHPRYRDLFGLADFEVTPLTQQWFKTMSEYDGVRYEFGIIGPELFVCEVCCEHNADAEERPVYRTLRLSSTAWMEHFGRSRYPSRLHALHSHWHWVEADCVVLRSPKASDRRVQFVVSLDRQGDAGDSAEAIPTKCIQVPLTDAELPYASIREQMFTYQHFVHLAAEVESVLSKFEAREYIHVLRNPTTRGLRIELPRFGLSFSLSSSASGELKLLSEQYTGYMLSSTQHFEGGFLPRFTHYLVLVREPTAITDAKAVELRMLTPQGCIERDPRTGTMQVRVPSEPEAHVPFVCYDEHRRLGTLVAETVSARVQLATICASGGTSLPCEKLEMTGSEAAIQLLRCCSSSRPYTVMEAELLANLCVLSYREPALKILVKRLVERGNRLAFLFGEYQRDGSKKPNTRNANAASAQCPSEQDGYAYQCRDPLLRCRLRYQLPDDDDAALNPVTGFSDVDQIANGRCRTCKGSTKREVKLMPSPISDDYVKMMEKKLSGFVLLLPGKSKEDAPPFPLLEGEANAIGCVMNDGLKASWRIYHAAPTRQVAPEFASPTALHFRLVAAFNDVASKRAMVESYLHECYLEATRDAGSQLRKAGNYVVTKPTRVDFLQCALSRATVGLLVPRLGYDGQHTFQRSAQQFLELCVLEDKLERLVAMVASDLGSSSWTAVASQQQQLLIEELLCVRLWDIAEHPYWLAFEVEGRIQIRPEQFTVATHLLENPGSMCQLNMGRGKTRVILPMLFLYLANRKVVARGAVSAKLKATRATILTPLISEMRHFLQRFLVASIAELGFVELPFHRLIELSPRAVRLVIEQLESAKQRGAVTLVAPEHRMSLELKLVELRNMQTESNSSASDARLTELLAYVLDNDNYTDVIDECDAVLHHKYHLVYADGSEAEPLDNGPARWEAAEALLIQVARSRRTPLGSRIAQALRGDEDGPRSCWCSEYAARLGAYDGTRLLPPPTDDPGVTQDDGLLLKEALVEDLLDNATEAYPWAAAFCDRYPSLRGQLVVALSDASVSVDDALGEFKSLLAPFISQLLALRGLVAFGVFEHCLEKRYRVEFGLPDTGKRSKLLAIPFRAADVPSERSEFSHPDVAIVLTLLGYYHAGLRDEELHESFATLLRLDASAQEHHYKQWYASVLGTEPIRLTTEERETLRDVRHLSLNDARQFALVCRVFRYCMPTINFFLNARVFPHETRQYPQRLTRSAWHLAANKEAVVGFSGTNDNQLLLPLLVKQHEPDEPDLLKTNGKMLDCILKATNGVELVQTSSDKLNVPSWQNVLSHALSRGARALIDVGALLAGVATHDAARFISKQTSEEEYVGVTFFDTRSAHNCWTVLDSKTGREMPLAASHIAERDTFVIFDEARARGSDMKLRVDASAVMTLGPRLTKDKLMQGAGRMRQLGGSGGGQTLWFVYLEDVAQRIRTHVGHHPSATAQLGAVNVLDWVMHNTRTEVTHGLIEWAGNGIQFERARQDPREEVVCDDWTLDTLYAAAHSSKKLAEIVTAKINERYRQTAGGKALKSLPTHLVSMIKHQALKFGLDDEAFVTAHTDECERELQLEEQLQEEREVERRVCTPLSEKEWAFERIVGAASVQSLASIVEISAVGDYFSGSIAARAGDGLHQIDWASAGDVRGTNNFFGTVKEGGRATPSTSAECLRMANAMLRFDDGSILLLSEYEADHVLEVLWREASSPSKKPVPRLCNLAFVLATLQDTAAPPALTVPYSPRLTMWSRLMENATTWKPLGVASAVACALWNGETTFDTRTVGLSTTNDNREQSGRQPPRSIGDITSGRLDDAAHEALRSLLAKVKQREAAMATFVGARGQRNRWECSPLFKLCRLMDLEACELHQSK